MRAAFEPFTGAQMWYFEKGFQKTQSVARILEEINFDWISEKY